MGLVLHLKQVNAGLLPGLRVPCIPGTSKPGHLAVLVKNNVPGVMEGCLQGCKAILSYSDHSQTVQEVSDHKT